MLWCCRIGYLKFWWRQAEMVWREIVRYFRACKHARLIEYGAANAGKVKSILVAEDVAARDAGGEPLRPQEV
jgi:hypothetical protein